MSSSETHENREPPSSSRYGDLWGHASLYLIFAAFVLYKAWQITFAYPLSSEVILPGLGSLDIKNWSALINGLGGWLSLSAIVSLSQPGRFARNLLRPLHAIDDEYIRKIFRHPVSFVVSFVTCLCTVLIVLSNISVELSTRYEVLASLPPGHGPGELARENEVGDEIRLKKGEPVQVLLRGWSSPEILVIRDRYNLTTLDAIELRRSWLGFRFTRLALTVEGQTVPERAESQFSIDQPSPFRLSIRGPLTFSDRAVLWAVVVDQDLIPGRLLPGEPEDGPEDPPDTDPQVSLYFRDLWTARDYFAGWTTGHQHHVEPAGLTLSHSTSDYVNRIIFKEGIVSWQGGKRTAKTKEAVFVVSKKPELPSTAALLAAMPLQSTANYQIVGLRRADASLQGP